jgi:hypothetical protein
VLIVISPTPCRSNIASTSTRLCLFPTPPHGPRLHRVPSEIKKNFPSPKLSRDRPFAANPIAATLFPLLTSTRPTPTVSFPPPPTQPPTLDSPITQLIFFLLSPSQTSQHAMTPPYTSRSTRSMPARLPKPLPDAAPPEPTVASTPAGTE